MTKWCHHDQYDHVAHSARVEDASAYNSPPFVGKIVQYLITFLLFHELKSFL